MFKTLKNANVKIAFALSTLLLAVGALYYPGTAGPYLLDDGYNIAGNKRLFIDQLSGATLLDAAISSDSGPLLRPIAMTSFALNYYFAGNSEPYSLKLTNIVLHLITALGIFLLSSQLLFHFNKDNPTADPVRQRWIALFIAALWGLHPLHVTTILYTVQRMNGLAGLFTVFAAVVYIKGREHLLRGEIAGLAWAGGAVVFGGALATLSKENGALLPVLLLAIELTAFRFHTHAAVPPLARRLLIGLLAIPTLAILTYLIYQTFDAENHYRIRSFNLGERLLTEARVIFLYLRWILLPDIRDMSLFHDDIPKSTSIFDPLTTSFALAGIVALVAAALAGLRHARWRPLSFAILWFLGGHLLESTTIALELVFEHRNYIPSLGPLFALGYYLTHNPMWIARLRPAVKLSLVVALLALPADGLYQRVKLWSTYQDIVVHEANNHPHSARAMFYLGYSFYESGAYRDALEYSLTAAQLNPHETTPAIIALSATYRLGEMPDEQLLLSIEQGFKNNPLTIYVVQQVAYLVEAHNAAANPGYRPTTDRILVAYVQALLDKRLHATARGRASAYYFLAAQSLQQKNEMAAIAALKQALAESPPAEDTAGIRLGLAKLYLARGELDKTENELNLIDVTALSDSRQTSLAEIQKQIARQKTKGN